MGKSRLLTYVIVLCLLVLYSSCATDYRLKKEKFVPFACEKKQLFKEPKYSVFLGIQEVEDHRLHRYVDEIMIRPSLEIIREALECNLHYNTIFRGIYVGSSYKKADYYLICHVKKFDFTEDPYIKKFSSPIFPLTFETEISTYLVNASTHDELWHGEPYSIKTKQAELQRDVVQLIYESVGEVVDEILENVLIAMELEFPEEEESPEEEKDTVVATPQQQQQQEQQMQQQIGPTIGPTIVIGGQSVTGEQSVQIKEYGIVSFNSTPPGAEVYIENNLIGNTPISKLRFQSGTYSVKMKMRGYKDWIRQIMVIANSDLTINADMDKSE